MLIKVEKKDRRLKWVPCEDLLRFEPGNVFLSQGWTKHWKDPGKPLFLELVESGARSGLVTIRDIHIPGVFRMWDVIAEPDLFGIDKNQASALAALLELARANRVDLVQSFFNMARWTDPGVRYMVSSGEVQDFGTYLVETSENLDRILARMHSKHRYNFRKSLKAGVYTEDQIDWKEFVSLLEETYAKGNRKLPFPVKYLRKLVQEPNIPIIAVSARSVSSGRLEAAVLVPYDARRGYYLHGGTRKDPLTGASIAAHTRVIQALAEKGVPLYDLGGARRNTRDPRLAGIFRFKRGFGGEFEDCMRWRLPLTARAKLFRAVAGIF